MPGIHDTQVRFARSARDGLGTSWETSRDALEERDTEEQVTVREAGVKNPILEHGVPGCVTLGEFHFLSGPLFPSGLVSSLAGLMQELALERVEDPPQGSISRPTGMPPQNPDLTPCKASASLSERRDGGFANSAQSSEWDLLEGPRFESGPLFQEVPRPSSAGIPRPPYRISFLPFVRSTNRGPLFCPPAPSHPIGVRLTLFHSTLLTRLVGRSSRRRRDRGYDQ